MQIPKGERTVLLRGQEDTGTYTFSAGVALIYNSAADSRLVLLWSRLAVSATQRPYRKYICFTLSPDWGHKLFRSPRPTPKKNISNAQS